MKGGGRHVSIIKTFLVTFSDFHWNTAFSEILTCECIQSYGSTGVHRRFVIRETALQKSCHVRGIARNVCLFLCSEFLFTSSLKELWSFKKIKRWEIPHANTLYVLPVIFHILKDHLWILLYLKDIVLYLFAEKIKITVCDSSDMRHELGLHWKRFSSPHTTPLTWTHLSVFPSARIHRIMDYRSFGTLKAFTVKCNINDV